MMCKRDHRIPRLFWPVVFFVLFIPMPALAYIGPGAGVAVIGSLVVILMATVSAAVALLTWPLRHLFRMIRCRRVFSRSRIKKCIILGLDGMDHGLTETLLAEGKLPNLARLQQQGCYKALATTVPPISPVAWSSFQTGSNPGKHNIFDFLMYDRRNYAPILSSTDIRGTGRCLKLGKYRLPLGRDDIRLQRKGKPFWVTLGEHGIFSSILRVPITFPAERFYGVQLSAMCVPDLCGTQGTFSFYTTQAQETDQHLVGRCFQVKREGSRIRHELVGPQNPFYQVEHLLTCPFEMTIKDDHRAELVINGERHELATDLCTGWIKVRFRMGPGLGVYGICRFLLLSTTPAFKLYVTPINLDPERPAMPVSYPSVYSTYLAKQQGPFATLGLAEDTWALNEHVLSDDAFVRQCTDIHTERETMLFDALEKTPRGLSVCVFDALDRIQHTFWREIEEGQRAEGNTIETFYQRMDSMVGKVMDRHVSEDTLLMIVSDHGFNAFKYGVDLNRWLEERGYLTLKSAGRHQRNLEGIDWSETRAFALGLSGISLNIRGRDAQGIVEPAEEAERLRRDIATELTALIHEEQDKAPVVKQVYDAQKVYRGPYKDRAPDLIVGFNKGYRVCWECAIGQVTDGVVHENKKPWSGDHCIDRSLVPGVLFSNRSIDNGNAHITDIGPTVLKQFGVDVPAYMDGKPLKVADARQSEAANREDVS